MIVEGNAPLAAAFAANIIAIYQDYKWNASVEAHRNDPKVWHGLVDNDQWQNSYLTGSELDEIKFWLGEQTASTPGPTTTPVNSGSSQPVSKTPKKKAPKKKAPEQKATTKKTLKKKASKK